MIPTAPGTVRTAAYMVGPKQPRKRGEPGPKVEPSSGPDFPGLRDAVRSGSPLQEQHAGGTGSGTGSAFTEGKNMANLLRHLRQVAPAAAVLSDRDLELVSHMAEIEELRKLDCLPGSKKLLAQLEARAKVSKGMASRAVQTHICRLNLIDLNNTQSSDRKTSYLVQLTDTLQKLVDEDEEQMQLPRSIASRLLLVLACREAVREGLPVVARGQIIRRQAAVMFRTQLHLPPPNAKNFDWVDPKDEVVLGPSIKQALQAERIEGETPLERLNKRWEMMTNIAKKTQQLAEEGGGIRGRDGMVEQVRGWKPGM